MSKEIQSRLERGYTMAIYGTSENIHRQMTEDIETLLKAINYSRSCVTPEDRNTQYIEADTIEHEKASNIEVEQLADKEFTDFEKKLSKWKNNTGYIHVWKKS